MTLILSLSPVHFSMSIQSKTRVTDYCPSISIETIFMNTKDGKTNKPHKFALNLSQRFDLRSSSKHVSLQNLSRIKTINSR